MVNDYTPQFYRNWLEYSAREIVSEMPTPGNPARKRAVRDRVCVSGIANDLKVVEMILENTLNPPSGAEVVAEYGQMSDWRKMRQATAFLAMQADLMQELAIEDKKRAEVVREKETKRQKHVEAEARKASPATLLLPLAEAHAAKDEYICGTFAAVTNVLGGPFRGCSIGCTIHDAKELGLLTERVDDGDHNAVAGLLFGGVSQLAKLQDDIFEELPPGDAINWTPELLRAVAAAPHRTDWNRVYHRWIAETMKRLLGMPYMCKHDFLRMAARRARDLNTMVADGMVVKYSDWCDAEISTNRWHAEVGPQAGSLCSLAYSLCMRAGCEQRSATMIAANAHGAGVTYEYMANALIKAIATGGKAVAS